MESNTAKANLARLTTVATRLGSLREQVMFLGGAVLPLLVSESVHPSLRFAKDVDLMVPTPSKAALWDFEDQFWELGLKRRSTGASCQWRLDGINVDVLTTNPGTVNFINPWGEQAMQNSQRHDLGGGVQIRTITSTHYLATKLAAFQRRGSGRFAMSKDVYDILLLLRGCPEIESDLSKHTSPELRSHLVSEMKALMAGCEQATAEPRVAADRAAKFFDQWRPEVRQRIAQIAAAAPSPAPADTAGPPLVKSGRKPREKP